MTYTSRIGESGVVISNTAYAFCEQNGPVATGVITHNVPSAAVLNVSKTDGASVVYRNQVLTYTISYTNVGVTPATAVSIRERLPVQLEALTNPGWVACGVNCWRYDRIDPLPGEGISGVASFVARVKSGCGAYEIIHQHGGDRRGRTRGPASAGI